MVIIDESIDLNL